MATTVEFKLDVAVPNGDALFQADLGALEKYSITNATVTMS